LQLHLQLRSSAQLQTKLCERMHWRVVLAGYSALMMAASLGFKDLVQKLLDKRADVNAEEKKGNK
jgi:hypothetical protein